MGFHLCWHEGSEPQVEWFETFADAKKFIRSKYPAAFVETSDPIACRVWPKIPPGPPFEDDGMVAMLSIESDEEFDESFEVIRVTNEILDHLAQRGFGIPPDFDVQRGAIAGRWQTAIQFFATGEENFRGILGIRVDPPDSDHPPYLVLTASTVPLNRHEPREGNWPIHSNESIHKAVDKAVETIASMYK